VVETSELSDQASQARKRKCRWSSTMNPSIHINLGLYYLVWLSLPAVLHETYLVGYKQQLQRLTRNTEQEDVTTLWVRHWWRHTSMTGSGGFTPGSPVSTHKKI
jgi:hypothetical protein